MSLRRSKRHRRIRDSTTPSVSESPHGQTQAAPSNPEKEQLLEEEYALHSKLAVVRVKLNTLTSTSLPTEVLHQIFQLLSPPLDLGHDLDCQQVGKMCKAVIAVSQVCHRWRIITISCPTLWTYVSPLQLGYEWTREILVRSKESPLTLDIRGDRNSKKIIKLAMAHLAHIRTLIVATRPNAVLGYASGSAPLLESMIIINSTSDLVYSEHPYSNAYHKIVKFNTPVLRTLILEHVELEYPNVNMITHLEMRGGFSIGSSSISVLQELSSLQSLALELFSFRDTEINVLPVMTLPSLTSIKVKGVTFNCATLLQSLRAPRVKAFTLICSSQTDDNDFPTLLAAVSALRAQNAAGIEAQLQQPHRLLVRMKPDLPGRVSYCSPFLDIRLADTESSQDCKEFYDTHRNTSWNPNWHLVFHYTPPTEQKITENEALSICKTLHLDNVTDAIVEGGSGTGDLFRRLLEQMPALRSLSVHKSAPIVIMEALKPTKKNQMAQLSALHFEGLEFQRIDNPGSSNRARTQVQQDYGDITGLIKVLEKRSRMGLSLPSLKLVGCSLPHSDGLDNLKNAANRMGVDYTAMGTKATETGGSSGCIII